MAPAFDVRFDAPTGPEGLPVLVAGEATDVEVRCQARDLPETLQYRLSWRTEGKGDTDAGVGAEGTTTAAGAVYRFRLGVPPGPWSYAGQLLKIRWELEVWSSTTGAGEVAIDVTVLPRDRVPRDRSAP